jgi:hypothetical protein
MEDSGCWIVGLPPDLIIQHDSKVIITQQVGMLCLQWFFFFLLSFGIGQQDKENHKEQEAYVQI